MAENVAERSFSSVLIRFGLGVGLAVLFALTLRWAFDALDLLILPESHPGLGAGVIDLAIALSVTIVSRSRLVTMVATGVLALQFALHIAVVFAIVEVPEITSFVPAVGFPITEHLLGLLFGPPDPLGAACSGIGLAALALRLIVPARGAAPHS